MSDEYEYGPWVDVPDGALLEVPSGPILRNFRSYRIATPKPKRELVVGKWYYAAASQVWRKVIAAGKCGAWLERSDDPGSATLWSMSSALDVIDWSTPPRDEAPK